MSLFTLEETCEQCGNAVWIETSKGRMVFDSCKENHEDEVDSLGGICLYHTNITEEEK